MNSSIQLLLNLEFLFEFLASNAYKKKITKEATKDLEIKEAGLFLDKVSKTIKIMGK